MGIIILLEIMDLKIKSQRVWTSYGISMILLPYLNYLDVIYLQSLNTFWYHAAVGRVQTKLSLL